MVLVELGHQAGEPVAVSYLCHLVAVEVARGHCLLSPEVMAAIPMAWPRQIPDQTCAICLREAHDVLRFTLGRASTTTGSVASGVAT